MTESTSNRALFVSTTIDGNVHVVEYCGHKGPGKRSAIKYVVEEGTRGDSEQTVYHHTQPCFE